PGPRSLVPGRVLARFARDRLGFLESVAREFGDVAYFAGLGARFALLNHPDLVRDVLVTRARQFHKGIGLERARLLLGTGLLTSEGEFHLRQRRLIQPAFHRERVAAHGAVMSRHAERHVGAWREGARLDVSREMSALTLAIAGKTLFDADVEGDTRAIGEALDQSIASFELVLLPFGPLLARTPIPAARRFERARARLDAIIYRLIAERRREVAEGAHDRGDLLTMLVRSQDPEEASAAAGRMTDAQLRDEALTILLAGHETTANALAWSWYFLARSPEAERALHAEVDAVLTAPGGAPRAAAVEDLPRLAYARMVVSEAMRLRPPAYLIGRRAMAPYEVPGTTWVIPAGTTVFLSQHLLHRDPRFWAAPDRFDPERWRTESPERPRLAYFPFGAGTRICIGEQFAWMELTLVLATIARRWRLTLVEDHPVEPHPVITLRAKHGIAMVTALR
ncbi:MAG TPA: cytochrome P450, partial [Gemmatimonadaceae bacterium]|nr:cytochrome P450 [Gemmatimonadaceae bacterium]